MRAISLLVLLACACPGAQVLMSGSGSKAGVFFFRYETRVEPETAGQRLSSLRGGISVDKVVHRWMADSTTKTYFGYDVSIEPEPGGMIRVTYRPLSITAEKLGLRPAGAWTQIPLPLVPAPENVRTTDTLALDLFVNPATGQKIVDYLTFEEGRQVVRLPSDEARDYTVEDVPLTLRKMRLSVNGAQVPEVGGTLSGEAVWFDLPDYGRYVLSLARNEELGFRKGGEVRGNRITMTWGADTFEIECDGPIAPGGGAFNLYVYTDPSRKPRSGRQFHFGAGNARLLVRARP